MAQEPQSCFNYYKCSRYNMQARLWRVSWSRGSMAWSTGAHLRACADVAVGVRRCVLCSEQGSILVLAPVTVESNEACQEEHAVKRLLLKLGAPIPSTREPSIDARSTVVTRSVKPVLEKARKNLDAQFVHPAKSRLKILVDGGIFSEFIQAFNGLHCNDTLSTMGRIYTQQSTCHHASKTSRLHGSATTMSTQFVASQSDTARKSHKQQCQCHHACLRAPTTGTVSMSSCTATIQVSPTPYQLEPKCGELEYTCR
eukprot:m.1584213 g.1584213  ORF g.1584213 m.1584213 type:complete len:256 (+) comp25320_c0_seq45:4328-5095(+)